MIAVVVGQSDDRGERLLPTDSGGGGPNMLAVR
jgi:hypothetical protein